MKRVRRSRAAAAANYDRLSPWYDWLTSAETIFTQAGLDLLAPQAGETILEIGCGSGGSLLELQQAAGPLGQVIGLDLSPGMLKAAGQKIGKTNQRGQIALLRGDGLRLPLAGGFCDAVFTSFTLELFDTPEIPLILAEIKRVLKKDGRLGLVALSRENAGAAVAFYEYLHDQWPALLDCRPIYAGALLAESGYKIIAKVLKEMWGLPVEIILTRPA